MPHPHQASSFTKTKMALKWLMYINISVMDEQLVTFL